MIRFSFQKQTQKYLIFKTKISTNTERKQTLMYGRGFISNLKKQKILDFEENAEHQPHFNAWSILFQKQTQKYFIFKKQFSKYRAQTRLESIVRFSFQKQTQKYLIFKKIKEMKSANPT
jgi:hypothetical protein